MENLESSIWEWDKKIHEFGACLAQRYYPQRTLSTGQHPRTAGPLHTVHPASQLPALEVVGEGGSRGARRQKAHTAQRASLPPLAEARPPQEAGSCSLSVWVGQQPPGLPVSLRSMPAATPVPFICPIWGELQEDHRVPCGLTLNH